MSLKGVQYFNFWTGFVLTGLGGLCIGASAHEALRPALFVSLPCFILGYVFIKQSVPQNKRTTQKFPTSTKSTAAVNAVPVVGEGLSQLEKTLDKTLKTYLHILQKSLSGYTYAVFLPTQWNEWSLRTYVSSSECVLPDASIVLGGGLLGLLHKKNTNRILECDIVTNSMQLGIYSQDEKIRSLVSVPIVVLGQRRGAILVDSKKADAFHEQDVQYLQRFSEILGEHIYRAYVSVEYRHQRDTLKKQLTKVTEKT